MNNPQPTLLFVDDEERILRSLELAFRHRYRVLTTTDGHEALAWLKREPVDVIVSDQRMPLITGVEVLREAKLIRPHAVRILLTGYADLSGVVGSINEGEIYRYIQKPWQLQALRDVIVDAVSISQQMRVIDTGQAKEIPGSGRVVVLHKKARLAELIASELPQAEVIAANDFDVALSLLEKNPDAMLLTDIELDEGDITGALSLLKQHRPELVMMVLTRFSDTRNLTRLINQVQVYRVLPIPLSRNMLFSSLASALRHQRTLHNNPVLRKRYKTEPAEADQFNAGLFTRVRTYLEKLRA